MPLTQTQLASEVAERSGLTKADAKAALAALEEIVLEELGNAEKVRIGGVVQLVVRVKEATKPRQGRNPATGEEITISAKPASVALKARPLAKAKAALPSVQKARKRLALGLSGTRLTSGRRRLRQLRRSPAALLRRARSRRRPRSPPPAAGATLPRSPTRRSPRAAPRRAQAGPS